MAALPGADADLSDAGRSTMGNRSAHSDDDAAVNETAQPTSAAMSAAPDVDLRSRFSDARTLAHRWKGRIFYAFVDQGFYSATNFALTILFASWLPLDGFGRYVVVWTVSLFIEAIQISMIIDSLPAIVSRHGRRNRQRMDIAALWVIIGFSLVSSLFLAGAAAVFLVLSKPHYAVPLFILALVNPLQRLYLFFRRLCYIRDRQPVAATAALAYGAMSLAGVCLLWFFNAISVGSALVVLGLGSAAAILVIYSAGLIPTVTIRPANVVWLAANIWSTGRWLAPASVISWLISWGVFPLVAIVSGPSSAGIVRALQNLLTPIVQVNSALNLAILPRVADKVADHGAPYARRFAMRTTTVFSMIGLAYCALILAAAPFVLPALYKKPEIAASAFLLWPLSLGIVCEATRIASSMSLLATRRTRVVFLARLASLTVFAAGGLTLGYAMGFIGVLWANAIGIAVGAVIVIGAALRRAPRDTSPPN
jgi:O-antigen/teichoic acid export membrane protein